MPSTAQERLSAGPFSSKRAISPLSPAGFERRLERAGVRLLPYPFDAAFAIASDVDGSSRETFAGYTNMLVNELGLDFGDSAWLHWRYAMNAEKVAIATNSGGFLSPSLTEDTDDDPRFFRRNRTFREMLADYHEGNVDHFHALLPHGPRLAVLTDVQKNGAALTADIPPTDVSCADFHVFAICFVFSGQVDPVLRSVRAEITQDGQSVSYNPIEHDHQPDGNSYLLFVRDVAPESTSAVPHILEVNRIVAEMGDPDGPSPLHIILLSSFGPILLHRLKHLREKYNVELQLITEHAKLHFRYPLATQHVKKVNARRYAERTDTIMAFNGSLEDETGKLIGSVDVDEPHSYARVLPEAVDDAELRFIVPAPASSSTGFHLTELLAQSPTRSGGGVYWAHRTMPALSAPQPGQAFDGKTNHDTFVARVERAMEAAAEQPGTCWPIYTHLGVIPRLEGIKTIPEPYFERGPLLDLQNRVFGISSDASGPGRIWFTRASAMYDYALVLHGITDNMERLSDGLIALRSWEDPVLGKMLPRTASQLYGVTFDVEDEASASVTLDGRPIEHIVRNPRGSCRSASVTIAECNISATLFRAIDPSSTPEAVVEGGDWTWQDGADPSGRLAPSGGGVAKLTIPMHGAMQPGAQLLSFRLRPPAGWQGGVLLETSSGGRFWFGSASLANAMGDLTASYHIDRLLRADEWQRIVVPFYDLSWSDTACPGGPLPSHAIEQMILVSAGPGGAAFGDVRLLRPRASRAADQPARGHCIVGNIPGAGPGETVSLSAVDGSHRIETQTDQLGWFAFSGIAPGVYQVTGSTAGAQYGSRRGPLVEVWSDIPRLELSERLFEGV